VFDSQKVDAFHNRYITMHFIVEKCNHLTTGKASFGIPEVSWGVKNSFTFILS
jgi:hypothetical protein